MIDAADRNFLIPCSRIFCYITNSERMIDMIVEAINKRTGKTVKIEKAYSGQRLTCPHCGVDVHPVLEVKTPFFRCYEGGKHTHYLCEQLEKSNNAYDPNLIDFEELFANLFRPVRECTPPVLPPCGGENPAEEPEEGVPGVETGEETDDGPDDESGTEHGGEPDDGNMGGEGVETEEPPAPVVLPCRTLSQLWKAGIHKFGPSERIGSHLRSDIFLWYKDFDRFFSRNTSLEERVIAVRPQWPINRANAILFASFSGIRGTSQYKTKYFILVFRDRKEYNKACKKLFSRSTDDAGTSRTKAKYDMVLVAGDWTELDESEYSAYGVKNSEHIYGAQISDFYSKNQIFPIPQQKRKEK